MYNLQESANSQSSYSGSETVCPQRMCIDTLYTEHVLISCVYVCVGWCVLHLLAPRRLRTTWTDRG